MLRQQRDKCAPGLGAPRATGSSRATGSRAGDRIAVSAGRRPPAAQSAALAEGQVGPPWVGWTAHLFGTACVRQRHSYEQAGPLRAGWTAPSRRPHACGSFVFMSWLDRSGQVGPPRLEDRMRAAVSLLRAGWTAQGRLDRPIRMRAKSHIRISSWQVGPPGQVGPPVTRMCDSSSWAGWTAQGRLDRPPHSGTSSSWQVGPPGQVGPPATCLWHHHRSYHGSWTARAGWTARHLRVAHQQASTSRSRTRTRSSITTRP